MPTCCLSVLYATSTEDDRGQTQGQEISDVLSHGVHLRTRLRRNADLGSGREVAQWSGCSFHVECLVGAKPQQAQDLRREIPWLIGSTRALIIAQGRSIFAGNLEGFSMEENSSSPGVVRFGAFELDLRAGELHKNGLKIKLQEQPFQVLAMLLRHPGEVVTREELQKTVWPADTFVDFDRGLNKTINKIREALGDSADNPRFVETLPRRGYRFIAAVDVGAVRKPPLGIRRWVVASVGVVVVAVSILAYVLGRPLPPPRVLRFAQITHDAQAKTWFPCGSWVVGSLATDGSRVYFVEGASLAQVSAAGGETVQMEPLLRDTDTALFGISPDRSDLLIAGSRTRSPSNKRG